MLVKCINNDLDFRVKVGNFYEVNYKLFVSNYLTIVNMPGKHKIEQFVKEDNTKFDKLDTYINPRRNPNTDNWFDIAYVLPDNQKIKMLDDKLHKIIDIKLGYDYGTNFKEKIKKVKLEGYKRWFNGDNFYYYSPIEALMIMRKEKMKQILK